MTRKTQKKICKKDLVDSIYQNARCNKFVIQDVVDDFLEQMKSALVAGNTIELRGFGTFEIRQRRGRANAHNPKTGQILEVEPRCMVAFRAGKEMKQLVKALPCDIQDKK